MSGSAFDGAATGNRGTRDATVPGAFDDMLNVVSARLDDTASVDTRDDYRDDGDTAEDRAAGEDATEEDRAEHRDDDRPRKIGQADATVLHVPFAPTAAAKNGPVSVPGQKGAADATTKPEAVAGFRFEAPAEMAAPGARLKLGTRVAQERPGVQSRPLATLLGGMTPGDTESILALRTGARAAAERKFAAGENAIERIAARKATAQESAATQQADATAGKRTTFAERMADLADRLAGRTPGQEPAPQPRPALAGMPGAANAVTAAAPGLRAGEPAAPALTTPDAATETAQVAAQTANRAVHGGNPTVQVASRAPQAPAGTPAEQVSVQIQHGVRDNNDRINVRLYPAALGKVEVKLELSPDRTVHAVVSAEKPETLDLLARDARILQRALEDAGLQTDSNSLSFQLSDGGDGAAQRFAGQQSGSFPETTGDTATDTAADLALAEASPEPRRAAHDGVLDVEI
jgi:flagellar hook-length control protein FliK